MARSNRAWIAASAAGVAALIVTGAQAATWTGATSTSFNNTGNWSPADVPDTSNEIAVFAGTPTTNKPNLDVTVTTNLDFQSAGWTFTGNAARTLTLQPGASAGVTYSLSSQNAASDPNALNTISANLNNSKNTPWNVGAGNTLYLTGKITLSSALDKQDVGTLIMGGANAGAGTAGVTATAGTTLVNYNTFTTSGTSRFATAGGTLGGNGTINLHTGGDASNVQLRVQSDGGTQGGTLSPGGDGSAEGGAAMGTLTVNFGSPNLTNTNFVDLYGLGTLQIDLSATNHSSDVLDINAVGTATAGGYLALNNQAGTQTLALRGPAVIPAGNDYTIVTMDNLGATDITYGSFDVVTYNGMTLSNSEVTVGYNLNSITVAFPVPEPSTIGVAAIGMLVLGRRVKHPQPPANSR